MSDPGDFYVEVGRRVRLARERLGLTQDSLATQVMLSRTSVTNIEKGRQKMLAHTLYSLAGALNVQPAELLPEAVTYSETDNTQSEIKGASASRTAGVSRKKRSKRVVHSR